MTDTFTSRIRLQQPTVGGDVGTWGTIYDTTLQLIDDAITGYTSVAIGGLSTYTLTAANGTSDQSRYNLVQFTGALTGNCTVTIPASVRRGFVQNSTTGGQTVTLTTGAGTTVIIPSDGLNYFFQCDATNIVSVKIADPTVVSSLTTDLSGYWKKDGLLKAWGTGVTSSGGLYTFSFPLPFSKQPVVTVSPVVNGGNSIIASVGAVTTTAANLWTSNSLTGAAFGVATVMWQAEGPA